MPVPYCGFDPCLTLTEAEQRILLFGILCTPDYSRQESFPHLPYIKHSNDSSELMTADTSQNDIDFEQLAGLCGYRPRSAEAMYKSARRKLLREFLNASDGAGSAPPLDSDSPDASQSADSSPSADNGDEDDQGSTPEKGTQDLSGFDSAYAQGPPEFDFA